MEKRKKTPGHARPSPTEAILESISDGVFTVDKDWRITYLNRAGEEITGVPREDAIGHLCADVFRSSLCGPDCALQQTLREGKPIIGQSCYIVSADGDRIPISISTAVLRDSEGKVIGGAETFRDISEIEALRRELEGKFAIGDLISRSTRMQRIFALLPAIAESHSTVLIQGQTGTGKEMLARTLHDLSPRHAAPFIAINCAALPDNLLESELFGYKAGAFTGASKDKPGRFALVKGGTLFLDEIGDISPAMQVRLLRVLQEREYEPLGATRSEKTEARIIAATNRHLAELVKQGRFREDLYYRINVVRIELPPLAQRKEDIPLLVTHFIERFNRLRNKSIHRVSHEALSLLMAYPWPGNVRELENVIERAFIMCDQEEIDIPHLPEELVASRLAYGGASPSRATHDWLDAESIRTALARNANNRLAAARELGIHKTTLFRKIKKLGIALPPQDGRSTKA